MGKEKKYASIGALLGAVIGFGVGLLLFALVDMYSIGILVFILWIIIGGVLSDEKMTRKGKIVLGITIFLMVFMGVGGVVEAYDVIIIVPFTVLGGIGGHSVSESLGRKADKRAYAELARRKQEREQVEQKKAEIIAKIDEELGEQNGNVS